MTGACLGIVAIIILVFSIATPYWYITEWNRYTYDTYLEEKWTSGLSTEFYDDGDEVSADGYGDSPLGTVAGTTKLFMVLGLIMAIGFVALGFIRALGKGGKRMRLLPFYVGLLAGIMPLIAVLYFSSAFPNAQADAFDGLPDEAVTSFGGGFYLALVGAFVCFGGGLMTYQKEVPTPTPVMQSAWGAQGMTSQTYSQQYIGQQTMQFPGIIPQQLPGQMPQQYFYQTGMPPIQLQTPPVTLAQPHPVIQTPSSMPKPQVSQGLSQMPQQAIGQQTSQIAPTQVIFCMYCGTELMSIARFCAKCGKPVGPL